MKWVARTAQELHVAIHIQCPCHFRNRTYFRLSIIIHVLFGPQNFGNLKNLETMDCSLNELEQLPSSLTEIPMLSDLDLSENQIKSLPSDWSKLFMLLWVVMGNALSLCAPSCLIVQLVACSCIWLIGLPSFRSMRFMTWCVLTMHTCMLIE